MLVKEIRKGGYNGGVGSDPKIRNVLVQGCTDGELGIESRSRVGCIGVQRSELMLRGHNNIVTHNRAAQSHAAGVDNTAADQVSGDTIHASHNNSPSRGLEEMFPSQGNMARDRGEGPSSLPGGESSEPMICEVSNQLKDLKEVVKTLVSDQRQTRERVEGLGAEVYQLQWGDAQHALIRPHERSSSRQSEDTVDAEIRARDKQLLIAQQELDCEIEQLKQQEIAASRQGAENAHKLREAL